jgi:hypothetical protein
MKKIKQRDKADKIFLATVILIPCIVLLGLAFAYAEICQQETGILDVCADQQDACVSLVLDQISQLGNWENEEITEQILSALDASDQQYWTFSSDQTILFVKNELETNTWKGFTTATYYSSDSARNFFQQLRLNRVTHDTIIVEEERYLVSGVAFDHQGATYQLCLLTNRHTVLENNHFMGAKILYWVLIGILLGLLAIIPNLLIRELREMNRSRKLLDENCRWLNDQLAKSSERFANLDLHNTQHNLWKPAMMPKFAAGLQDRGVCPVTLMRIHCDTANDRRQFLTLAPYTLDRTVLRFEASGSDLILIFVGSDDEAALLSVWPLLSQTVTIQKAIKAGTQDGPTIECAALELENMQESDLWQSELSENIS